MKRWLVLLLSIILALLCACGGEQAQSSGQSAFTWQIELQKCEVRDKLHTDEGIQQYDGSVLNTAHDEVPQAGSVFLILTMTVTKSGTGGSPFEWSNLTVRDASGNAYTRMENDSFLSEHIYNRLPGTRLQIGENRGSICLELPEKAVKGKLTLCYDAGDEGVNTLNIKTT